MSKINVPIDAEELVNSIVYIRDDETSKIKEYKIKEYIADKDSKLDLFKVKINEDETELIPVSDFEGKILKVKN